MLTPQEIQEQKFEKAVFGGYDMAQIDKFLDVVLNDYTSLYKENTALKAKMRVLVDKIEEYRAVDEELRKTLYNAQIAAKDTVSRAQTEAERILRGMPANNAEWYYLMGSIAYRKGWMDDARQNFWTAANMDPTNMEYRQAVNSMGMQARRGAYGGGDDLANLCTTLCCLNCLCNSCSG